MKKERSNYFHKGDWQIFQCKGCLSYKQRISIFMYDVRPNLVLGFHGCDQAICDALLSNPNRIKISREPFDWLGHGMYFWENNYERAWDWAKDKYKRGKIKEPAVVGAVLDLGYCCDFLGAKHIGMFKYFYNEIFKTYRKSGTTLPENKDLPGDRHKGKLLRILDCAVIEYMHQDISEQIVKDLNVRGFMRLRLPDSVRGAFVEGGPVFEGSGIYEKTHIQICIRNPNCIKGFFLPRRERASGSAYYDISDVTEDGYLVSEPREHYGA